VTTQSASCFILFLSVSAWVGLPANGGAQPVSPPVLVLLQNDADVPPAVVAKAQAEVVRLYGLIGVEVTWVTKVPEPGSRPAAQHNLLGVVIAHELGHMLLPNQSHAKRGLMEEAWNSGHFRAASAGLLLFADESGELIRRGLVAEASLAQRADRRRP